MEVAFEIDKEQNEREREMYQAFIVALEKKRSLSFDKKLN